jgi:hypothetical protein
MLFDLGHALWWFAGFCSISFAIQSLADRFSLGRLMQVTAFVALIFAFVAAYMANQ